MDIDLKKIVRLLTRIGLTQVQIAEAIPCSQSVVSDIANGKICQKNPSYRVVNGLITLAKKQGLTISQDEAGKFAPRKLKDRRKK